MTYAQTVKNEIRIKSSGYLMNTLYMLWWMQGCGIGIGIGIGIGRN